MQSRMRARASRAVTLRSNDVSDAAPAHSAGHPVEGGDDSVSIGLAGPADVDELQRLLESNAPSHGGTPTGEFPREKVERWVASGMPVVVARDGSGIAGVLFSAERSDASPVVAAMFRAWPGRPQTYVYGPVCIAARARGHRLPERLYTELRRILPGRDALLFIRRDNLASLRAHARLGMHQVAAFEHEGTFYIALSDGVKAP